LSGENTAQYADYIVALLADQRAPTEAGTATAERSIERSEEEK